MCPCPGSGVPLHGPIASVVCGVFRRSITLNLDDQDGGPICSRIHDHAFCMPVRISRGTGKVETRTDMRRPGFGEMLPFTGLCIPVQNPEIVSCLPCHN